MHALDNPVWSSLTGPHAAIAEGAGRARRYPVDVAPFAAVVEDGWDDLAALAAGHPARLIQPDATPPPRWDVLARIPVHQMVATRVIDAPPAPLLTLGGADADDMLALVAVTAPGPFERRTVELGGYLGVRDGGALVAMGGERMRPPGYGEISAVCTSPAHRGRGLATALVRAVAARIAARGDLPMLHVRASNVDAIRVYARLGFEIRTTFDVLQVRAPS